MQSNGWSGWAERLLVLPATLAALLATLALGSVPASAAGRHASMAIDANSGAVLHEQAADEPRYPASLTKMMTLYIVFELMEQGRLSPSTRIRISEEAADTSPSKLGLREGADIALIDAIRAIIVKSANDISVAVAEHIAGSEDKFAQLMTRKARQLGMNSTTFRNAHGLPDSGQLTTARDMLTLALRLNDDFPNQYKLFSTRSFTYNGAAMRNHNTMLSSYDGMDGIKTGYTQASGFNLVSSVRRDGKHVVAVVFGGSSAAARNVYMRAILDRSLRRAATERTREKAPRAVLVARGERRSAPKLVEPVKPAVARATVPARPEAAKTPDAQRRASETHAAAAVPRKASVETPKVRPVVMVPRTRTERQPAVSAPPALAEAPAEVGRGGRAASPAPAPAPQRADAGQMPFPIAHWSAFVRPPSSLQAQAEQLQRGEPTAAEPATRTMAFATPGLVAPTRLQGPPSERQAAPSARSGTTIQVGAYATEAEAQKHLALARDKAAGHLASARPSTQPVNSGNRQLWRARFVGLDERSAMAACSDLRRHQIDCQVVRE